MEGTYFARCLRMLLPERGSLDKKSSLLGVSKETLRRWLDEHGKIKPPWGPPKIENITRMCERAGFPDVIRAHLVAVIMGSAYDFPAEMDSDVKAEKARLTEILRSGSPVVDEKAGNGEKRLGLVSALQGVKRHPATRPVEVTTVVFIPILNEFKIIRIVTPVALLPPLRWIPFRLSELEDLVIDPVNARAIIVDDEMMYPHFKLGDLVLIDCKQKDVTQSPGSIYAFVMHNTIHFAWLTYLPEPKTYVITPGNENYQPSQISSEKLRILGQVIWCGRAY